jgi:hypothetical protein
LDNAIQESEGKKRTDKEIEKLRRAVWTGDYSEFSNLITEVHSEDTDSLRRGLLHLAAERGDARMVEALLDTFSSDCLRMEPLSMRRMTLMDVVHYHGPTWRVTMTLLRYCSRTELMRRQRISLGKRHSC